MKFNQFKWHFEIRIVCSTCAFRAFDSTHPPLAHTHTKFNRKRLSATIVDLMNFWFWNACLLSWTCWLATSIRFAVDNQTNIRCPVPTHIKKIDFHYLSTITGILYWVLFSPGAHLSLHLLNQSNCSVGACVCAHIGKFVSFFKASSH